MRSKHEKSEVISISRRRFLGTSVLGVVAATYLTRGAADLQADPLGLAIGCQTWPVRESIGKDLDGTLRRLAADGYQTIEMCSPPGYKDTGFGRLASMRGSEMREKIRAAGLSCESCHFGLGVLKDHVDERLAWAKELGLKQMIIASFGLPKGATMADWMRAADQANQIGERVRKAGIQLGPGRSGRDPVEANTPCQQPAPSHCSNIRLRLVTSARHFTGACGSRL
jgi:hypothetical protein